MAGISLGPLLRGVAIVTVDKSGKGIFGAQQRAHNPDFVSSVELDLYRKAEARIIIDGKTTEIYPKDVV